MRQPRAEELAISPTSRTATLQMTPPILTFYRTSILRRSGTSLTQRRTKCRRI